MVAIMRIDAPSLLAAQTQRPAAVKAPAQQSGFQPLDYAKPPGGQGAKQSASPGMALRPGAQLDIKV
jgi:hypothetical protein